MERATANAQIATRYPPDLLHLYTLISLYTTLTLAATPDEWRRQSIYQISTDRFSRTDGSTTAPCDPSERVHCGGTWRGIIQRLDYIVAMGFTAIWLSPIAQQVEGKTAVGEAYHGYWTKNLYALNSKFGTENDFRDLVNACHARGLLVMLDVALNHYANPVSGESVHFEEFTPFNDARYFHPKCEIDWGKQSSIELCWMGNGYLWLPDIDTENEQVVNTLVAYVKNIVSKYSIDGLRLDATRNVPKPFWARISQASGVYCQGEVWSREPEVVCPYQESMDSLHNYPFKELATEAFTTSNGNLSEFAQVGREMQTQCKDVTLFGTFMENHDNPRLGSITTDRARLRTLAVLNILSDGIPIVYYGQEQMLAGSNDPLNREALWLTKYATTNNLVPTFTLLNAFRSFLIRYPAPFTRALAVYTVLSNNLVTVRKGDVLLVLTNSGSGVVTNALVSGFAADEWLVEILTCRVLRADGAGLATLTLTGEPMVLYPRTLLLTSGICGL